MTVSGFTINFVSRFVTMSSSKKRKISSKTLKEKYEAIKKLESGCANKNVAADYDVSPSTLSTWLKSKDKIVKAFEGGTSSKTQKLKPCGNENLERALYTWFVQMRRQGVPVSGPVLREKALSYAKEMDVKDFIASNSWFDRWKSRHGVAFKAIAGEAQSCTLEMTASWKESTLPTLLSNYALRDIFNADEFGLFYKALPDKSMHLKSEDCVGGKCSKVRLTGLAAAIATGEKLPMFVIGKSKKPRCFNGVRNLPCRYRAQKKSWMDSQLFEDWVREQDRKFEREGRKVALVVDNCPAHPDVADLKAIHLVFLPPNTTCKTQPMDQGVIKATKAYYRASVVRRYIDAVEKGKGAPNISVLDAMTILTRAWNKVTPETIKNCFKKAGICSEAQTIAINDLDNPFAVLSEEIQSLREAYPEAVPANVNADDVIGIDDAVSTSESGSLTDEEILAEFSSDQEAMEEEEETDEVEVLEECPKKPTASEVRSAIDVPTSYSLFVNEGVEEIRSHVQKIEALAERNFRSSQRQQTLLSFFGSKMQSPLNNKDQ